MSARGKNGSGSSHAVFFASLGTAIGSRRIPWRSSFGDGGIAPKVTSLIAAICAHCRRSIRLGHWALHPCTAVYVRRRKIRGV